MSKKKATEDSQGSADMPDVTKEEIELSFKDMKNNRAPGETK